VHLQTAEKHSRELPAATLGKPLFSWVASAEWPFALPFPTLCMPQNLWAAAADWSVPTLGTPQNLWAASAVVYRTTLETQLNPLVGDWVSAPP